MAWTLDALREVWREAPDDDELLTLYLTTAEEQVTEFAPADFETEHEERFLLAVLLQLRNLWNANKVDPASGGYGDEGFSFTAFPMDWSVKNIIRPKRAVPVIA